MMNLFLGVIFICLSKNCGFLQAVQPETSEAKCVAGLRAEAQRIKTQNPDAILDSACLVVRIKGA